MINGTILSVVKSVDQMMLMPCLCYISVLALLPCTNIANLMRDYYLRSYTCTFTENAEEDDIRRGCSCYDTTSSMSLVEFSR